MADNSIKFEQVDRFRYPVRAVNYHIFMGLPGCGKSTHKDVLVDVYGNPIDVLGMGDVIRSEIEKNTDLGMRVKPIVAAGKLIDDDTVIKLAGARLKVRNMILDGYPRNLAQAKSVMLLVSTMAHMLNIKIQPLLHILDIDEALATRRLLNRTDGRLDDNAAAIKTRIKIAKEQTKVLEKYFTSQNVPILCTDANIDIKGDRSAYAMRTYQFRKFLNQNSAQRM